MHRKKVILRGLLILLFIVLAFPVYYVIDIVVTSLIIKNFQSVIKSSRQKIEYFSFSDLESVIKKNINNTKYHIYPFAHHTEGSVALERDRNKNIVIQNTDIKDVYGSVHNQNTQDIYNFRAAYINISDASTVIKLYNNFYINLQIKNKQTDIEMRGDSLVFNLQNNSILSESPVLFNTEDIILIGGNFFYRDHHITLIKDIFFDSNRMMILSDKVDVYITDSEPSSSGDKRVSFKKAVFTGNVKMFDRSTDTHIDANIISIDNQKQIATLRGNVKIQRPNETASGDVMMYNLPQGYAAMHSSKEDSKKRVTIKIRY